MKTFARCFCGFATGWIIYMVAMVLTVYDGLFSFIFQPFMAVLFSGIFVALSLIAGLPLRAPRIRNFWSRMGWCPLLVTAASIGVMTFHAQLGLQEKLTTPETNQTIMTMSPLAAVICYFLTIFPIVNLPSKR